MNDKIKLSLRGIPLRGMTKQSHEIASSDLVGIAMTEKWKSISSRTGVPRRIGAPSRTGVPRRIAAPSRTGVSPVYDFCVLCGAAFNNARNF